MDIKEESCFLDFCSENESDTEDCVKKIKIETVASSSDIKSELEEYSMCPQNEEHHLMRFNETIKESEIETKMDIKEEDLWLKREDLCINDIKETYEDIYSTGSPSLCKGVSSYTSILSPKGDLQNAFNVDKDNPECESDRKCQGQNSVVTDMSSIETSVCSESSDDGKIVNHEDIKPHKCNTCHKSFSELSKLKTHILIHEGIKPHKCNICNKAFTQLSNLKTHKLIHDGTKPHKCNTCNKAFTTSSHLKRHTLIHEGIKPHRCNICKKAFTQLSNLKIHKLIHQGTQPHLCNICNKTFTHLSHLKRHQLIHEGIKPHKCIICDKDFTRASILKRHQLVHEDIKPHKCNICNKAFTQSSSLNRHKLIHQNK